MNNENLIRNLEYKIKQQPYVRNINNGLCISYVIKIVVYKRTNNEIFSKLYRYDYKVIDNKICDVEYFIINDTQ